MKMKDTALLILAFIIILAVTGCPGPGSTTDNGGGAGNPNNTGRDQDGGTVDQSQTGDDAGKITLADLSRGLAVWKANNCTSCHKIGSDPGGTDGPNLTGVGGRLSKSEIKTLIRDPQSVNPDSTMPPFNLSDEDLEYLARYLSLLSSDTVADKFSEH